MIGAGVSLVTEAGAALGIGEVVVLAIGVDAVLGIREGVVLRRRMAVRVVMGSKGQWGGWRWFEGNRNR